MNIRALISLTLLSFVFFISSCANISQTSDFSQHIVANHNADENEILNKFKNFISNASSDEEKRSLVKKQCDEKQDDLACFFYLAMLDAQKINESNKLTYVRKAYQYNQSYCEQGRATSCLYMPMFFDLLQKNENNTQNLKQALQKTRQTAQKACLSQIMPKSCIFFEVLYSDKQYLSDNELAFFETIDTKNYQQAKIIGEKLCPQNPHICGYLGLIEKEDKTKAYNYLQHACNAGFAYSCNHASNFATGKDKVFLLEKACNMGVRDFLGIIKPNPELTPCFDTAVAYTCGLGVKQDLKKAKKYHLKNCQNGGFKGVNREECGTKLESIINATNKTCSVMKRQ
ncbi:MAG: sel1 repeat family protein [Neisseriaceae bacterium]|nr:sel1 repeat family protein [Neisseriaceae bacterium]